MCEPRSISPKGRGFAPAGAVLVFRAHRGMNRRRAAWFAHVSRPTIAITRTALAPGDHVAGTSHLNIVITISSSTSWMPSHTIGFSNGCNGGSGTMRAYVAPRASRGAVELGTDDDGRAHRDVAQSEHVGVQDPHASM
jgi:hypothetical protein